MKNVFFDSPDDKGGSSSEAEDITLDRRNFIKAGAGKIGRAHV